jgi:2-polyprenyl-6-methoxyphenol hydroxylase-like FAD-dependent oxidoreductase
MLAVETRVKQAAQKIFQPYWLQRERVDWYSSYHIGQAVASNYLLKERVFIVGDACHTHRVNP